jgi:hypothetical protein
MGLGQLPRAGSPHDAAEEGGETRRHGRAVGQGEQRLETYLGDDVRAGTEIEPARPVGDLALHRGVAGHHLHPVFHAGDGLGPQPPCLREWQERLQLGRGGGQPLRFRCGQTGRFGQTGGHRRLITQAELEHRGVQGATVEALALPGPAQIFPVQHPPPHHPVAQSLEVHASPPTLPSWPGSEVAPGPACP